MINRFQPVLIAALVAAFSIAAQAQPAKGKNDDPVVARVNGQPITRSAVVEFYSQLPSPMNQIPLDQLAPGIINELAARRLLGEAAEKAKLGDDPEVKQQLKAVREQVLEQAYLDRKVTAEVTDAKMKARYDELIKAQPPQEEVHARHILAATEADAQAALDEVKKGADFAEVSKKRSIGPTAATGGDLGFFTKDKMVPEFAEAAFALQPGQVSDKPVHTQFGWHVIKVEERRQSPPPSFDEVRDQVHKIMADEVIQKTVDDLRKSAKVETYEWPSASGKKLPAIAPDAPSSKKK
ncbi:MAG TPA: peptidylprolyl isomerase [Ferrovibrio sp.]|uniref:peptidylprolyl isomerase n=1 Tax=Ferrovibrio sp. TaxID=1917215 RepID=UPI002ED65E47